MPAPSQTKRRSPRAPDRYTPDLKPLSAAAGFWHCNERTVRRMVAAGELRAYRVGRVLRIDMHQVRELTQPVPPESVSA